MNFQLSSEVEAVKKLTNDFVQKEILPHIRAWDEEHHFERSVVDKLARLGLMGVCIPERYGGAGLEYNALAVVCTELEKGDTAFRTAVSVHTALNSLTLYQWGNEEQKQRFLVPQAQGLKLGAFGLTEPDAGSDVASMQSRARKDGDGYILTGQKVWISLADYADHFIIFAKTDPDKGHRGISAFVVERNAPGLVTRPIRGKLGIHAGNTGEVFLDEVRVPSSQRLGEEGEGFAIAMSALDNGRFTVAAGATGIIDASLESSLTYAHARQTFGKEIGRHQLVQQMIAKMVASLETSRLLTYKVGWLKNEGKRCTQEVSLAKWYACDRAWESANDALEIHGAYGYSNEYPIERHLRNARALVIYEGTREIHQLVQAEYALGYRRDRPVRMPLPKYEA